MDAAIVLVAGAGPQAEATAAAARAMAPPHDHTVRVEIVDHPAGAVAAWSEAITRTAGFDTVAILRAGATPHPTWLDQAWRALDADPTLAAIVPSTDGRRRDAVVIDDGAVIRRGRYERAQGFDTLLPLGLAGFDLGWRLWLHGERLRTEPAARVELAGTEPPVDAAGVAVVVDRIEALLDLRRRSVAELWRVALDATRDDPRIGPPLREVAATRPDASRARRPRAAVVTADSLGSHLAGPGIRALRIAQAVAAVADVQLLTTGRSEAVDLGVPHRAVTTEELGDLAEDLDVMVVQGWVTSGNGRVLRSPVTLVADVYDPIHLEQLEQGKDIVGGDGWSRTVNASTWMLNEQLLRADFLVCAHDRQRDFWLGQLASLSRLAVSNYVDDSSLRNLIDVVPFGTDPHPTALPAGAMRGVVPGIGPDDQVLLWGGGVYNWFDPVLLVRAVDRLRHDHPRLRLLFLGMRHPNPEIPRMRAAHDTVRAATEAGLVGTHVFFNESWVPFEERLGYLADADIGVSMHLDHIETAFSFRTRILDYLWAGLPVVTTAGDVLGDLVERRGAGRTVPAGDLDALVAALDELLRDDDARARCAAAATAAADELRWSKVLEPLVAACAQPRRAPELACPDTQGILGHGMTALGPSRLRHDLDLLKRYWRTGGPSFVASRLVARVRRLMGRAA